MSLLETTLAAIVSVSEETRKVAEERQNQLTKPPGSLGQLEALGVQLAAIAEECPAPIPEPAVVGLFAGDHGVCAQGVTPWPQEVTVQMLLNIAAGGAAINALSRQVGATVQVTDVGVASKYPPEAGVRIRNVRAGTADFTEASAMSMDEARAAVEVGIEAAFEAIDGGARCLLTGEMGIGNTTSSSALISVFTRCSPAQVTGRGAGADDEMLSRKVAVIEQALKLHQPQADDPLAVLAAVGGLEQAALAGFILGGASRRVPVILDGVIACSAALVAVAFSAPAQGYLISGHAGAEPGIRVAVEALGLRPLVDLDLRLGEGSGAAVALPAVQAAARIMREMATFADVGIAHG